MCLQAILEFEDVVKTAEKAIREFINGEPSSYKIYEMEHPDVLLWAVWALQQYAKETSRENCRQMYGNLLEEIVDYIHERRHDNLFLHENGLLYTNGTEKAVTWMNSTANGRPVIPRTGYIVEVNALWYNALRFVADMVREGGNEILADTLDAQAEITGKSFVDVFRNEYGYLFDYVDGYIMDWSVRPNMIFTVAFDYSPLDRAQKKQVLDIVTKELLTPKGLRTLSPKSGGYNPNYVGPQIQRDYAYHQGTAWPWLMGFYMEAYLRIYKVSGVSFVERYPTVIWYVLRYADVLLLYAEALNEWKGGPTTDAYAAINKVRKRGYGNKGNYSLPEGMDQATFRKAVHKERAYELAFEGHRRLDLIRWGIYYETIQETYNELKNWWSSASYVVYDYTKKGQHELMPIPQREMDLCTQFNQNPGW